MAASMIQIGISTDFHELTTGRRHLEPVECKLRLEAKEIVKHVFLTHWDGVSLIHCLPEQKKVIFKLFD
jgi:hypothetical protein